MILLRFSELDSTQAFLARHPELGFCGVLAEAQTSGRGRGENHWESAADAGLWLSAALPLQPHLPAGLLLQSAMNAVIEVLRPCGVALGLKWPNDLVVWSGVGRSKGGDSHRKVSPHLVKLGGILGEVKGSRVILGLGLNLQSAPRIPERPIPPGCLADFSPLLPQDTTELARALLEAWQDLTLPRRPAFRWPEAGDAIRWEEGEGVCDGWEEADGRLRVRRGDRLERLVSGDVSGLRLG